MKLSVLKNIIRESIKQLMTEQQINQTHSPCGGDCHQIFPGCGPWLKGIMKLGPFTSSPNPLQPCTFINNKINQIQTTIAGINPNNSTGIQYAAQLNCKLDAFIWLKNQNGC